MKGVTSNTKLFLLPSLHKQGGGGGGAASPATLLGPHHRLWLIAFISFFTFASLLTLLSTTTTTTTSSPPPPPTATTPAPSLPHHVSDALLHYAALSNASGRMPDPDLRLAAAVLRRRAPCNLLVFGLTHETPLWRALNAGGRTVFVDESEYYIAHLEARHPGLEAYDVAYTTHVRDLPELLLSAASHPDCRPKQNLLFSDCRLAVNDLPNDLYSVEWDVIIVDGPRGYDGESPGRMSAVFTAAVMARWRNAGPTEVLVHDYEREVERVCSERFLCKHNLVAAAGQLAHFAIGVGSGGADKFCTSTTSPEGSQ